jgi:hypothetical protein
MAASTNIKLKGFKLQADPKSPTQIAPSDRVPPQPGQGMPMNKRIGQITGPFLKPDVLSEASRISNQAKIRKVILKILDLISIFVKFLLKRNPELVPKFIPKRGYQGNEGKN